MNSKIKILQITDCHLQGNPEHSLKGYNPERRLEAVIAAAAAQLQGLDNDSAKADHLLLTGDLAQQPQLSVYRRILKKTAALAARTHWVPGNHDDSAMMAEFAQMDKKIIIDGHWAIVLLDSTASPDGRGSGSLSNAELELISTLNVLPVEHILLVLHHPPVAVGSVWQDQIKLANAQQFWQRVDKLGNVRAVLFGHLHQEQQLQRQGIALYCTPATAPQFKKCQLTPILEDDPKLAAAGFRLLQLEVDGSINTTVYRVD
ncbi:MAG: metallophosphoesterase [Pseudomonadales bacterium]|nr:metallophosphoesterase [Pseudomonadales bacterium]